MTMTIPRAAFGVFALLVTVATIDVSRAMAQTTTITPTVCGAGTEKACGSEPVTKCEHSFSLDLNLFMQSGGIKWTTSNCTAGYKTLYKDVKSTGGTSDGVLTCGTSSTAHGGGSTGTGLSGMRGSGEDEDAVSICEF
jgi:hypothetical protein